MVKDCNENGTPDECDIDSLTSDDVNGDGVPDECQGGCCLCGGCVDTTAVDCSVREGVFSGLGVTCVAAACTPPPSFANDDCSQKELLPSVTDQIIPIDNRCATLDGPFLVPCEFAPDDSLFGTDLWFNYVPPCTGEMTVSMCDNTFYDAIMGIYGGGATCQCPTDNSSLIECGDDTCGVGGGPPTITTSVAAGNCYTIRVGGWNGSKGTGEMNISVVCAGCLASSAPEPELVLDHTGSLVVHTKNRYLSFSAGDAGQLQAVRVTFTDLSGAFDVWNGLMMWAGEPQLISERTDRGLDRPCTADDPCFGNTFLASRLQCEPFFADWSILDVVDVWGVAVIPDAAYCIQVVEAGCSVIEEASFSDPLNLSTSRWGDTVRPPVGGIWTASDGEPGALDVRAFIRKFTGLVDPRTPVADIAGVDPAGPSPIPDGKIFINDLTDLLDAFFGRSYLHR